MRAEGPHLPSAVLRHRIHPRVCQTAAGISWSNPFPQTRSVQRADRVLEATIAADALNRPLPIIQAQTLGYVGRGDQEQGRSNRLSRDGNLQRQARGHRWRCMGPGEKALTCLGAPLLARRAGSRDRSSLLVGLPAIAKHQHHHAGMRVQI